MARRKSYADKIADYKAALALEKERAAEALLEDRRERKRVASAERRRWERVEAKWTEELHAKWGAIGSRRSGLSLPAFLERARNRGLRSDKNWRFVIGGGCWNYFYGLR